MGASGVFATNTNNMKIEVLAVRTAFLWFELQNYIHACILSQSLSKVQRAGVGFMSIHCIESLQMSTTSHNSLHTRKQSVGKQTADSLAGIISISSINHKIEPT